MAKSLFVCAVCFVALCASAQAADQEFKAFWVNFKQALQKNDKTKLVSMIQCPILFHSEQLGPEQLRQKIDKVLSAKVRKCMVSQKPTMQKGVYFFFCGDEIYSFSKVNGRYLLTGVDAND